VDDGKRVMAEMLKGGIDEGVVGREKGKLEAPVEVEPVAVEKTREDAPEEIEVDGHEEGNYEHGEGSYKLIRPVVRNDRERAGIVEQVVVLVLVPEELEPMPHPMVHPLEQIRLQPQKEKGKEMVVPRVPARSTKGSGSPASRQIKRKRGTKRSKKISLKHKDNFRAHHLRSGILRMDFVSPCFICGICIIRKK